MMAVSTGSLHGAFHKLEQEGSLVEMTSRTKLWALSAGALALSLALAGCGSSGGGSAAGTTSTTTTTPTTPPPSTTEPTPLQAAVDLDNMLAEIDVDQALADAIKYSGMLTSGAVGGDSATAAENAGKVLTAEMTIEDAVTMADDVIDAANAAKMAAEDIEDEAEKAAVLVLLASAIEKANMLKTAAQAIIDGTKTSGDEEFRNQLSEAVALVEGTGDDPKSAADIGDDIAAAILDAFTDATDRITPSTTTNAEPGGLPDDPETVLHNRMGLSWHAALGSMDPVKAGMLDSNNLIVQVDAVSAAGVSFAAADGDLTNFTAPQTIGNGASADGTYKGIAGTVFCGGDDCKAEDDELTGSWYFTPTTESSGHTWIDDDGRFIAETLFARWGYWVSGDTDATVNTFAYSPGNTANLDLTRGADATEDVTASYTGDVIGIAVRDGKSGHFTADVNLTATFGENVTDSMLGGYISSFGGDVADPDWHVTLRDAQLGANGAIRDGMAFGGTDPGAWTAQGYGPGPVENENQRPAGFFGTFNANFAEGEHAAGAYATR